jgi:alkanesulfonate monooxygenase SsuD/methylene tetrahydromethanopterin reductase-like flavin-dependent oxidoreductase (luciferase family)
VTGTQSTPPPSATRDPGEAPPRFAVNLPQVVDGLPAREISRFAARAEAYDFRRLWTFDQTLPGRPPGVLDGLQTLAFAAASTRHVGLAVGVLAVPQRDPRRLAKELASLDVLADGRLVVGLGLGLASGPAPGPRERRAALLEDGVSRLRASWRAPAGAPSPRRAGGPPQWFGGGAPPALDRAARIADGWIGAGAVGPDDFARQVARVYAGLGRHGRARADFAIAKRVFIGVDEDSRRLDRALARIYGRDGLAAAAVCGSPQRCAEALDALFAAGAGELILHPLLDHLDQLDALHAVRSLVVAR